MRLRRTFLTRRPTGWSVLVPLVAVLAGFLFATSSRVAAGGSLRSEVLGLPDLIRAQDRSNARRSLELTRLQQEVDALAAANEPNTHEMDELGAKAKALAAPVGRTPVEGHAVTVTLTDSKLTSDKIPPGFTVDDIVIHQQDVQAVVNALWAGGAEAMMLQDQRVIATSAVRCVGNTLILKGRVYSPPFTVRAIGDPAKLRAALDSSPEIAIFKEYVSAVGVGYEVSESAKASFPAYQGNIVPKYARVDRS